MPGRAAHRQPIPAPGHYRMAPRLESSGLEDRRQGAGQERGPLARTGSSPRPPRGELALGQGPRRPPDERARRRPGAQGRVRGASRPEDRERNLLSSSFPWETITTETEKLSMAAGWPFWIGYPPIPASPSTQRGSG